MTAKDIGEIRREFKPGVDNLIAGVILGLLMIGGGCAAAFYSSRPMFQNGGQMPLWAEKGASWATTGLILALGIGLIIGGFFLIRWMRSLFSLRVRVGEHGFSVAAGDATQVFTWDNIISVVETHLYERPPILKGAAKLVLPKSKSRSFTVLGNENEEFDFNGTSIKGHTQLAAMIKEETDLRNIPWEVVEVHA